MNKEFSNETKGFKNAQRVISKSWQGVRSHNEKLENKGYFW